MLTIEKIKIKKQIIGVFIVWFLAICISMPWMFYEIHNHQAALLIKMDANTKALLQQRDKVAHEKNRYVASMLQAKLDAMARNLQQEQMIITKEAAIAHQLASSQTTLLSQMQKALTASTQKTLITPSNAYVPTMQAEDSISKPLSPQR